MKYRVVLEVIFTDGTADKVGIYSYDDDASALKGFYSYMSQYVGNENVKTINVIMKDSFGSIYKNELWNRNGIISENV